MKVHLNKGLLVPVLQKIQSITEKKTNMPILLNTLIKASDGGKVEFSATDLEMSLWTHIEGEVEVPGSTTVSAKKLLEVIRELPQESITLDQLPSGKLLVRAGRAKFELATIHAEDFPYINTYDNLELVPCDTTILRRAMQKTLYGVPMEEEAFAIAGLYWHPAGLGEYRFVSTDGHRLAVFKVSSDSLPKLDDGRGIIIPRKGVIEILRVLEKPTEASLGRLENVLVVRTDDSLLSVQLLESEFPEYELIIPTERPFSVTIDWSQLYHAVKRVSVLTTPTWCYVRFLITKGTLELQAGNPELGDAVDVIDIDYDGDDFSVAFNVKYVMETLQAMESANVVFEWVDELHGGIFLGSDDPDYLSLIMPMVV